MSLLTEPAGRARDTAAQSSALPALTGPASESDGRPPGARSPEARRRTQRRRSLVAALLALALLAGWVLLGQFSPASVRDAQTMTTSQLSAGQRYIATEVAVLAQDELEAAGLPAEDVERGQTITLMTVLQESSLRNLRHGDADSLGLFQQRPSMGWGSDEQVRDPRWAVSAFLGTNDDVENPGLLDVDGWQTMDPNDAAQTVQRSNHPEQYGRWEPLASSLRAEAASGYSSHRAEAERTAAHGNGQRTEAERTTGP
ncbi:hypothetical protein [Brevibacterium album]|uniref:hypothetical protein n=1 Tax=Brevibacterium album TaxID=417948 RepID=UPI00040ED237|nr:hypothetical protein [Brevibacterium album]